jgi:hypothetical protein
VAAAYSVEFKHKGKIFQLIFQNRVNTDPTMTVTVPKGTELPNTGQPIPSDYYVTAPCAIRPYGICIREKPSHQPQKQGCIMM